MDISSDGLYLATGGKDQTLKIWSVKTKELFHNFSGHKKAILSILFLFDSSELCSGSSDGQIIFWNAEQRGKTQTVFGHRSQILSLSNIAKRQIVSVGYDRKTILWNVEQSKQFVFESQ